MIKNSTISTIISAGDMTGNLTSSVMPIRNLDNFSVQCTFTGTPTGTFAVQVSNDQTNWTSLASPPTAAAGSPGTSRGVYTNVPDGFLRVTYTAGSSTGSLTVIVCGKGI